MRVIVDRRVTDRHPELTVGDVEHAVVHAVCSQARMGSEPLQYLGVGPDHAGRILQWITFQVDANTWHVYHAMRLTKKVQRELGLPQ